MACSSSGLPFSEETINRWFSSELEGPDLLDIIVPCSENIVSCLEDDTLSIKSISLLIHLLARAARCTLLSDRTKVYDLLTVVVDSPLLNLKGIQLLVDCENVCEHSISCIFNDFVILLQTIFTYMPSSLATTHIIGFIDLLKTKINDADDFENKDDLMDQVFELKNSIMSNIADWKIPKTDFKSKNYEDEMKPPESFRIMSVMPKDDDLLYQTTFLRRNKKFGKYVDLEHYLDVQFRLYREDCISPLREVFEEFRRKITEKRYFRLDSGRIYRDIQILKGTSTSLEHGEVFVVELDLAHCKRIKWGNSKRLIFGSLLLLSFDNFNSTLFAVVSEADRDILREKGQFKAQIFKTHVNQQIPRETLGIILEATSAYFEAYYHVLNAIQAIQEDTLPFQKYIVHSNKDIEMPRFLQMNHESTFDLKPIIRNRPITFDEDIDPLEVRRQTLRRMLGKLPEIKKQQYDVKLLETDNWPSKEVLNLDESQRQAFITALTKEFVLIQGPPGTGKTHLGLQIAKALLHNRHKWRLQPGDGDDEGNVRRNRIRTKNPCLLVVCFTNHALDQFVEGIINFLPENRKSESSSPEVVRIGSQCKNPNVEKYSIKTLRRDYNRQEKAHIVLREAEECKMKYLYMREILKTLQNKKIVLFFKLMNQVMDERHKRNFSDSSEQAWFDWLHVSLKTWFEQVEKRRNVKTFNKLHTKKTEVEKDPDVIDIVDEDEYERTERSLDEDIEFVLDTNKIGIDVEIQLENVMVKETNCQTNLPERTQGNMMDKRCEEILLEEAERVKRELRSSDIADILLLDTNNLWRLPLADRWEMYRYWLKLYIDKTKEDLYRAEQNFNEIFKRYKNARVQIDEEIMRKVSVIAMTTTGAAKYNESLKRISPQITIIEEAAEVPEAHIVTAINPQCEHLILIGDHKQLEPKPAVRELAIKYNLSISLFERMLNNGLHYHCLERQHRMRPDISNLVRHMYPVLEDNENVHQYENIKGIKQNLFFLDHNHEEQYNEDGKSFSNEFEANFISQLCDYLLKQGYKPSDITILAAYTGQMFCIRGKLPRSRFEGVNISVLDNYQGEENEIILLSLVRSNENGDIGFLNRENRICVALSRAKKGLYILGNSSTLTSRSKHWQIVMNKLKHSRTETSIDSVENFASFGKALSLFCQNHPDVDGILASMPDDFGKSPDGGCERRCETRLNCGHACRYFCHPVDRNHEEYICEKFCWKHCQDGHVCQKQCHFPDDCQCSVIMERLLDCSHTVELECYLDPKQQQCQVYVMRNLKCGHDVELKCCVDPDVHECIVKVRGNRQNCGHEFTRYCHDKDFEKNIKCVVRIEKKFSSCDHTKKVPCSLDLTRYRCGTNVEKSLDCGHIIIVKCHLSNVSSVCPETCAMTCENGHICKRTCHYGSSCKCKELMNKIVPKCGHMNSVPCSQDAGTFENCHEDVILLRTLCGHQVTVECREKIKIDEASSIRKERLQKEIKCKQLVEYEIPKCKHLQMVECWQTGKHYSTPSVLGGRFSFMSDRTTLPEIKCLNDVIAELECGHTKNVACWQRDRIQEEKTLYRSLYLRRYRSIVKDIECNSVVTVELECGHSTDIECCKKDSFKATHFKCEVIIDVERVPCGHTVTTECYKKLHVIHNEACYEDITFVYPECQHEIQIKCNQNPNFQRSKSLRTNLIPPCSAIVKRMLDCGHLMSIPCHIKNLECENKCEKPLFCGHPCLDLCRHCQKRGTHSSCRSRCYQELFCGHYCEGSQCLQCKPCTKKCEFSCEHSKCNQRCKDTCKPCGKPCNWICPHFKCTKTCAEECDRPICSEDCKLTLVCGHACPGYCGEPCPKACPSCNADSYKGFPNDSLDEKCVTLRYCGHSFGCTYIDEYMESNSALVKRCPLCQTVIIGHPRYNALLKRNKQYLEEIKTQLKKVTGKSILFPVVDLRITDHFAKYVGNFLTYTRNKNYTEPDRKSQSEIRHLKEKGEKLISSILHIPNRNFQTFMDLSNEVFSLYVEWVLRLCSKNKKLMEKEFNLESNESVGSQNFLSENEKETDIVEYTANVDGQSKSESESDQSNLISTLKGLFSQISLFSSTIENIQQDGASAHDGVSTKETINNDKTLHNQTEREMIKPLSILNGHGVIQLVQTCMRNNDVKKAKDLIDLMLPYMEGEAYFDDAINYPQLTIAMGVHATEWTVCETGHVTPAVLPGSCLHCSDVEDIQWVPKNDDASLNARDGDSSNKRGRRGKGKRGKNNPSTKDGSQLQLFGEKNGFTTSSFDQFTSESPHNARGFSKGRGRGNQRRPYEHGQNRGEIHNAVQSPPNRGQIGFDNMHSSQRGRQEENRSRGRGNRRQRQRGGRQGSENTRSSFADSVRDSLFNFRQEPSQENMSDRNQDQGFNSRGRNRGRGRRRGGRNR